MAAFLIGVALAFAVRWAQWRAAREDIASTPAPAEPESSIIITGRGLETDA